MRDTTTRDLHVSVLRAGASRLCVSHVVSAVGLPCVGYQLPAAAPLILIFPSQCVIVLLRHAGLPLVFC
jgi:hypothetical protein